MTSRYIAPKSLDQALEVLARVEVQVMAGGTDLMILLRQARLDGSKRPEVLLDITGLPELNRLDLEGPRPYLGAAVSFRRLETTPAVHQAFLALALAAASVGSVQVRHLATIGGNVANASPAADGITALVALKAKAEIVSPRGVRFSLLEDLITGPNRTTLSPDELIVGFELDRPADPHGQVFSKVGRRKAMTIARLNVAVCLGPDLVDPRIVLGACFPSPRRLSQVEELVAKGPAGRELWEMAGRMAADQFVSVCGLRSSTPYKVPAISQVMARALAQAWMKIGGKL